MPRSPSDEYDPCPHCGEHWPQTTKVCRHCGYSDEYERSDDHYLADDFDYDEFVAREFPEHGDRSSSFARRRTWIRWIVLAIVASLVLSLLLW